MKIVPFDEARWKAGWQPVTSRGVPISGLTDMRQYQSEVHYVGLIGGLTFSWGASANLIPHSNSQLSPKCGSSGLTLPPLHLPPNHIDTMLSLVVPEPVREWWYRLNGSESAFFDNKGIRPGPQHELVCIREKTEGNWRILSDKQLDYQFCIDNNWRVLSNDEMREALKELTQAFESKP